MAVASAGLYAYLHLIPDNHANIPPLSFLQAGCPSCHPNNSVKALKAKREEHKITYRSGTYTSQIDYFSVHQADRKCVKDCTIIPGEAAVKQHRILVMDMRIQSVKTGYRPKQKPGIRSWKLKGENLVKFKHEIQEKMNNHEVTWDKLKYT